MNRMHYKSACRKALALGLLPLIVACSNRSEDGEPLIDAISKAVGFALPADATILAYRHQHDDEEGGQCSQLWVVQSTTRLTGPDRRTKRNLAESPFASLQLLVEEMTDGRVAIEAAGQPNCVCIEWQHNETMCRLRQARTRTGWVAVLEAVAPE